MARQRETIPEALGSNELLRLLHRYEASYDVIVKRMLSKAPIDIRDELHNVVAIVLGRCRELEDKIGEQGKKATSLSKEKTLLNQKTEQLNKLLASSKSSAKAMSNKVSGECQALFRRFV